MREWGDLSADERDAVVARLVDFVALVDETGTFSHVGGVVSAVVGAPAADLVGTPVVDAVHEADTDAVDSLLATARRHPPGTNTDDGQPPDSVTVRVTVGDGEWRWVEFTPISHPGADDGGDVALLVRDSTGHTQTVQWFKHLVETASDLLVVLDEQGVFTYLTPASERMFDYRPDELRGEQALDYIHPDDRPMVEAELGRGLAEPGYTATVEHRFRAKSGEWRWFESRGRSLDESAINGRIVVVTRDVTERRRREQRIAAQNEQLDAFAGVVSHDLQGPLAVASGSLELYRRTGDETLLNRIERAHDRMSRLTSELLTLAREGTVAEGFEPVALAECAEAALGTTDLSDAAVTIADELPTVRGDGTRLRSVFENLFGNVATHAGESTQVWVEPLPDGAGFFVEDDGPGLPSDEDERAALFDAGQSGCADGTGFGLHIVETIATGHGWTVTATEGRHGGARFEFRGVDAVPSD